MKRLQVKVAVVTGAGRGIGRAIALKLAAEGAQVLVNDLDEDPALEVVDTIGKSGGTARACVGSVTAADFGERFVKTAMDAWGDLHIIVNNAGYSWDNVIQKTSDEQFQAMLDVHLVAPFRILRAAAEPIRMLAKRETADGRPVMRKVVNISSIAAGGNAGLAGYSSGKAAVTGLTRTLAKEWGRYNVNVNCVAFGLIDTRLSQPLGSEESTFEFEGRSIRMGIQTDNLAAMKASIPMGRLGTVDEAAGAVYLLCTPESDYISGQTVTCGGGYTWAA